MGLNNITPSEHVLVENYVLFFEWNDTPGAGYGFSCDSEGNLLVDELLTNVGPDDRGVYWYENYRWCLMNDGGIIHFQGMENRSHTYREPAHGTCDCGTEVWLENDYGHGIDCDGCNRVYNMGGQELAPRSQWTDRYDEDSTQPYNVEFGYAREDY